MREEKKQPLIAEIAVEIMLDEDLKIYEPGEKISGKFIITGKDTARVKVVELSILWHTMGKGEEDFAVHHFKRYGNGQKRIEELELPQQFEATLPQSPLSYEGVLLKVCWCIRVRVFFPKKKDVLQEATFQLGNVPTAQIAEIAVPLTDEETPINK